MHLSDWLTWQWRYHGTLDHIHDGDTIFVLKDSGEHTYIMVSLRFKDIDAPELDATGGKEARDHLTTLIAPGDTIYWESFKEPMSFNRYVSTVYVARPDGTMLNLCDQMVKDGFAVVVKGK